MGIHCPRNRSLSGQRSPGFLNQVAWTCEPSLLMLLLSSTKVLVPLVLWRMRMLHLLQSPQQAQSSSSSREQSVQLCHSCDMCRFAFQSLLLAQASRPSYLVHSCPKGSFLSHSSKCLCLHHSLVFPSPCLWTFLYTPFTCLSHLSSPSGCCPLPSARLHP